MFVFMVCILLAGTIAQDDYFAPVIGILTQQTHGKMGKFGGSYLAASYVKYVESSGAQVIPILDWWDTDYLTHILHSINGVLIPGGEQMFPAENKTYGSLQFYDTGRKIYELAKEMNKNGNHFPVWGTCLGFELMLAVEADVNEDIRFNCSSVSANNLTLSAAAHHSKLFGKMDNTLYTAMQSEPIIFNAHHFCVSPDQVTDPEKAISKSYDLLATDWDRFGQEYVALVEHKYLPFYASQFHPEKNAFEWSIYSKVPHTRNAVHIMQYMGNFFVNEANKCRNRFEDPNEFYKLNIENFPTVYTLRAMNSTQQTCYFFDKNEMMEF